MISETIVTFILVVHFLIGFVLYGTTIANIRHQENEKCFAESNEFPKLIKQADNIVSKIIILIGCLVIGSIVVICDIEKISFKYGFKLW